MTLAGKILVFANLLLSLGMAAWAIALYTQRVNWNDKPPPEAVQGELSKRNEQHIKPLTDEVKLAEKRFGEARAQLAALQAQRQKNLAWYQSHIDYITGEVKGGQVVGATDQNPAQVPVLVGGQTAPDDRIPSLPKMEAAKDRTGASLRCYLAYVGDLYKTQDLIAAESTRLAEVNKKAEENTKIIVGTEEMMGAKPVVKPGLRQLLENEQNKISRIEGEKERLKPLLVNSYAEIQFLAKRREQLERQVKGLEKGTPVDK
jgi:hypothetical protein